MKANFEFALGNAELKYISSLLEDLYPLDALLWVHQGILVAPRLISIGALSSFKEVNLLDPSFRINSIQVASTMRMLGLASYGVLYFALLKRFNIARWEDINLIITAIQYADKKTDSKSRALWISSIVELNDGNELMFSNRPMFADSISEEVDYCDEVLMKTFQLLDDGDVKNKSGLEKFLDALKSALNEEEDVTDFTDDDILD